MEEITVLASVMFTNYGFRFWLKNVTCFSSLILEALVLEVGVVNTVANNDLPRVSVEGYQNKKLRIILKVLRFIYVNLAK